MSNIYVLWVLFHTLGPLHGEQLTWQPVTQYTTLAECRVTAIYGDHARVCLPQGVKPN